MKEYLGLIIWSAIVAIAFGYLWYTGRLKRFAAYVQETKEELRKCTWPTWEELKGSTTVVMISIVLLGLFTVASDFILAMLVKVMVQ